MFTTSNNMPDPHDDYLRGGYDENDCGSIYNENDYGSISNAYPRALRGPSSSAGLLVPAPSDPAGQPHPDLVEYDEGIFPTAPLPPTGRTSRSDDADFCPQCEVRPPSTGTLSSPSASLTPPTASWTTTSRDFCTSDTLLAASVARRADGTGDVDVGAIASSQKNVAVLAHQEVVLPFNGRHVASGGAGLGIDHDRSPDRLVLYVQNVPNRYTPVPVLQMLFANNLLLNNAEAVISRPPLRGAVPTSVEENPTDHVAFRRLVVESALRSPVADIREAAKRYDEDARRWMELLYHNAKTIEPEMPPLIAGCGIVETTEYHTPGGSL